MEIITSNSNKQIKNVMQLLKSRKQRNEQGLFVCEGRRMLDEAVRFAPDRIEKIIVSESFYEQYLSPDSAASGTCSEFLSLPGWNENRLSERVLEVKSSVFDSMSETVTPQGVMIVVREENYSIDKLLADDTAVKRLLILEDIQDPGNLGTMIRTAEAAGIGMVLMSKGTTDITAPKVIRSTMGSVFRVPHAYTDDLTGDLNKLKQNGIKVFAAYLRDGADYTTVDMSGSVGILIGNEGNGLSDEAVAAASSNVFIPMAGQVESLNAAIAAAVLMFHK